MRHLIVDTETTGFTKPRLPIDHPDQPHIVQLAAQLCEDDGVPAAGFVFIVRPGDGVTIPAAASAVHGITDEMAAELGMPLDVVMDALRALTTRADILVAHNIAFDRSIIETAMSRRYRSPERLGGQMFCTMESAAPIVNLPPTERMMAAGIVKPKSPKLSECMRHFFGEEFEEHAHDAMADVVACRRVYFHLRKLQQEVAQ